MRNLFAAGCLLLAASPRLVQAQTTLQASLDVLAQQQPAPLQSLDDGDSFTISAGAVGGFAEAVFTLRNRGAIEVTVLNVNLSGSVEFALRELPIFPFPLAPRETVRIVVRYTAATPARAFSRLIFSYREPIGPVTPFTLNLTGAAPDLSVSSVLQPAGNALLLPPGGKLSFPSTNLGTSATTSIVVTNRGSGPGTLRSVSLTGEDYQLSGLPLLPAPIEAARDLRFNLVFSPRRIGAAAGTLEVVLDTMTQRYTIEGAGISSALEYQVLTESAANSVRPGQSIALPEAAVGQKSTVRIRVVNQGNAEARIAALSVSGAAFQLPDPPFLPAVIAPGGSLSFNLTYTATQPGPEAGRLRIGDDTFDLQGTGIGSSLAFTYAIGQGPTPVVHNGTIVFNSLPVGKSVSATLVAANRGTAPATLTVIGISGSSSFSIKAVPQLPLSIDAGKSLELQIDFAPSSLGAIAATLRVDSTVFNLSGAGTDPPPLPSYRIEGFRTEEAPMQQLSVTLSLAEPYPLALTGTIAAEHSSDAFSADPTVQFATGGKSVAFTVPAGVTKAIFQNQSELVRLQTGSVSGVISLRPAFAAGQGINLTGPGAPGASIQVLPIPPKILAAAVVSRAQNGFTLQVTGFANTRAVSQMEFEFIPASGTSLAPQKATLNVEPAFLLWYQSQQSQQYGSLFSASIPFTLQGTGSGGQPIADALQTVSITMANQVGVSDRVAIELR